MAGSISPLQKGNTMSTLHRHPALSLRGRATAVAAAGALAAALVAAGPAMAEPKGGAQAKRCPVEDANGTTSTVAVGTRVGLFVCGSDGEWHFGWLINARAADPPPQPGLAPVGAVAVTRTLAQP
jgi:hypothetical protein